MMRERSTSNPLTAYSSPPLGQSSHSGPLYPRGTGSAQLQHRPVSPHHALPKLASLPVATTGGSAPPSGTTAPSASLAGRTAHSSHPRSALRVNTDLARYRAAAPQAALPSAPYDSSISSHHFTQSLSNGSGSALTMPPLSDAGESVVSVEGRRATEAPASPRSEQMLASGSRDVMMAVNGLRAALDDSTPVSPLRPKSPSRPRAQTASSVTASQPPPPPLPPSSSAEGHGASRSIGMSQTEEHTLKRIREALDRSTDEGDTLDLSRRGIEGIGPEAVVIFDQGVGKDRKGVWRLALSYNSLRDGCIDDSFSQLARLRYLNLKGNNFTHFPQALTEMPSLEILDLSKNKLSAFPQEPGNLSKLKVLSLSNNKITALPSYLTNFNSLKVFKVDGNPIEWPPREVLGLLIDNDVRTDPSGQKARSGSTERSRKDDSLRPWIENMKSWMRQGGAEPGTAQSKKAQEQEAPVTSDEEPMSALSADGPMSAGPWDKQSSTSLATLISQHVTREEPLQPPRPPFARHRSATVSSGQPQGLSVSSMGSISGSDDLSGRYRSTPSSPTPSTPLQPQSASTASSSAHSRTPSANLQLPYPAPTPAGHTRGASLTSTQRHSGVLSSKKSLPDLRQSHAKIMQERRESGGSVGDAVKSPTTALRSPDVGSPRFPGATEGGTESTAITPTPGQKFRPAMERNRSMEPTKRGQASPAGRGIGGAEGQNDASQVDESRNSYFRRLSTLPVSSISKAVPDALLRFIDAIRGILFALSQLHTALRQFLLFAADDRIAGVFTRVMEPANRFLTNLINALDRFDSMSRRDRPPVRAIREVISATKESVGVFAKVVAVLQMQVPALKTCDVRYTRTLLLMVYGSMAEVAESWRAMAPLVAEMRDIAALGPSAASKPTRLPQAPLGGLKMMITGSFPGRTPISPIPERGESLSPPSVGPKAGTAIGNSPLSQTIDAGLASPTTTPSRRTRAAAHRARRKGGSFSSQDLEKGMLMGAPKDGEDTLTVGTPAYGRRLAAKGARAVPLEEEDEEEEEGEGGEDGDGPDRDEEDGEADEEEEEEEEIADVAELGGMPPRPGTAMSGAAVPMTPPDHAAGPQGGSTPIVASQSQPGRSRHQASSSSGSSHALPVLSGMSRPLRKLSVDVRPQTPASATLFDDEMLDTMEKATEMAFIVWLKLAEDVRAPPHQTSVHSKSASSVSQNDGAPSAPTSGDPSQPLQDPSGDSIPAKHRADLIDLLRSSERITSTLRECLMGVRVNPHHAASVALAEAAQAFIKTVVRVSEMVKVISATHTFPPAVRQSCGRLTQATRECAIMMQVSSLPLRSASATPAPPTSSVSSAALSAARMQHAQRTYSPMQLSRSHQGPGAVTPMTAAGSRGPAGSSEDPFGTHAPPPSTPLYALPSASRSASFTHWVGGQVGVVAPPPTTGGGGLRGLQLPNRQAMLARNRAATFGEGMTGQHRPGDTHGSSVSSVAKPNRQPSSAQADQTIF